MPCRPLRAAEVLTLKPWLRPAKGCLQLAIPAKEFPNPCGKKSGSRFLRHDSEAQASALRSSASGCRKQAVQRGSSLHTTANADASNCVCRAASPTVREINPGQTASQIKIRHASLRVRLVTLWNF